MDAPSSDADSSSSLGSERCSCLRDLSLAPTWSAVATIPVIARSRSRELARNVDSSCGSGS